MSSVRAELVCEAARKEPDPAALVLPLTAQGNPKSADERQPKSRSLSASLHHCGPRYRTSTQRGHSGQQRYHSGSRGVRGGWFGDL